MWRMKLLAWLAGVALLLCATPVAAQIGQTATLAGVVTDTSGAILPGVSVTVSGEAIIGGTRTTVTDENGAFRFPSLPPGAFEVKYELSGFRTITQEARLQLGQTITADAKPEVGGIQESVTVVGAASTVDAKSSGAQKNLSTAILENVPMSTRFGPGAMLLASG